MKRGTRRPLLSPPLFHPLRASVQPESEMGRLGEEGVGLIDAGPNKNPKASRQSEFTPQWGGLGVVETLTMK